ncbi:ArnT family glycosyltransferase [Desulfosarcina cetonica]|uniref:ArnT family glycosyltransferase n=1 Tax=Desulfosarcina cetonica TaxID=90730 RepID=UPI00155D8FCD|nr:glycosyltransferase family 39 protein [Desulfosarcina cetonica]
MIVIISAIFLMGSVPPVSRDALTHHLAVPKIWIEKGIFTELPGIPFSYYPMNLDLLYMVPLYWGNDIVPKYIHFSFALLTALLIYTHVKRRVDRVYGLLGALFFLSIPVIVKLSTAVYVDLGLIFFSASALFALICWVEDGCRIRYLLLSALSCGLAMGTKYNGLIVFLLLSCFVPVLYVRRANDEALNGTQPVNQFKALGFGIVFAIGSLLVFSPWMIKNLYMTGNPIYPLYKNVFSNATETQEKYVAETEGGEASEKEKKRNANSGWTHFSVRKAVYGEPLWQIVLIPIRVFFEGVDDNPKHFDGRLNPFLLILPLLLIWAGKKQGNGRRFESKILSLFAIAYLLFVFFKIDMRIRWIGPIIPPLVVLCMYSLANLRRLGESYAVKWKASLLMGFARVFVIAMLAWNAQYVHALYRKIDPEPYIAGEVSREDYITRFRPEYELIRYINSQLHENSIILCLFIGDRIYYFDRQIYWDPKILSKAVNDADSIDQIGANLSNLGITHLLVRFDLTQSWIKRTFDHENEALLRTYFQRRATQIGKHGGYGLFALNATKK